MQPSRAHSLSREIKVCLVTEELAGIGGSGGIGAAFLELAQLLAQRGASVDVLYCPVSGTIALEEQERLVSRFMTDGIKLRFLDAAAHVTEPITYEKKSYAIARTLSTSLHKYAFIHFHDYKGLGYFSTSLKKQGLAFLESELIVQLHGPTRWTIEANKAFFVHEDQLKIDFMERVSIAQADRVVSPSAYLVEWLRKNDFTLPPTVDVIKNVCSQLGGVLKQYRWRSEENSGSPSDVVLFARHEDRKGFAVFCDALDLLHDELVAARITVSFVGKFGMVGAEPSGIYLIDRAKRWKFPIRVRTGLDRNAAAQYIASRPRPLVVIPSPFENSPYTVLESIMLGVPVISSLGGGGRELFADPDYPGLCEITARALAEAIECALKQGLAVPKPSESAQDIEHHWLELHARAPVSMSSKAVGTAKPKVTFAITHHERPRKLIDAVLSAVRQTYTNMEIIVVDDGSSSETTIAELEKVENILTRVGGRLVRRENGYLGAARNTALQAAQGEFICFLDDDDIAFPELVETLVQAAVSSGADAVNCMNVFMDESIRGEALSGSPKAPSKVSYVPLGGPLALAPTENCLGAATALFRKAALLKLGGYTELKGVGHEDYELFIRMVQAGMRLTIVPSPLYFYEVGRPSMLSRTSMVANFRRCFDAIDVSRNSNAWRDLVSLNAGKHTSVNAHNRQWWLYSQTKTADLRKRMLEKPCNRTEALDCLRGIAAAEGVERARIAFEEDVKADDLAVSEEEFVLFDDICADVAQQSRTLPQNDDGRLLDIRLDVALGRFDDAVRALSAYVTAMGVVRGGAVAVMKQLLNDPNRGIAAADAWRGLATALKGARLSRETLGEINASLPCLHMLAQDAQAVFLSILPQLDGLERDYLARHPDVAAAVSRRQFSSGLDHYLSFGMQEGRSGFDSLNRIVDFSLNDPAMNDVAEKVLAAARSKIMKDITEAKSLS